MFLYDVLGRFPTREEALIALAEYNKNPYSVSDREITFSQLYEKFYKNKYEMGGKTYSQSSINCTKSAYKHCSALYDIAYRKLRADDFRDILGQKNNQGNALSHALQEHIKNLFNQMDKFPLQNDIIDKGYASFASITVSEDDTPGVPFTTEELQLLWKNRDFPWVDSTSTAYTKLFKSTLNSIGITIYHTPHDCRHTFTSLLDSAGVNQVCIDRLIGHAPNSLTTRTYTHKTIEELKQAIEMI